MKQIDEQLAIDGGTPVRTTPMPDGKRWDWDELKEVLDVFESGKLHRFGGEKVAAFERAFADFYGTKHAVACTSGTAAIHIAIGMINPEPGDEIIAAPINDGGGIVPILYQGAIPVFADSNRETFCMDPAAIEACITPRTRAIMVVHLAGNPCDMDAILDIGKRHHIPVIEDASQAHGARYKGKLCGTMGDIGCFSLQSSKHITTCEGGMVLTNNKDYYERGAFFMDKGWSRKPGYGARSYLFLGPNYRLAEILGAIGLAQLRKLPDIVTRRCHNGELLRSLIADAPHIHSQKVLSEAQHSYWLYPMTINADAPFDADQFAAALSAEGIGAMPHYIGEPIFMCMEAVCHHVTLGNSQFPFSHPNARAIEYNENTCPTTRDILQRWVAVGINTFQSDADIADTATAIIKVARGLDRK